ncbi:MAG: hypothetical protein JXB46_10640, partial [Candidatus Eisenbacteria bacterium]|nr:hypothetical protein [Candidatus Eisenbacteria bacterium]
MTVEEAIRTSIEYETRVRDVYSEAAARTEHPDGQRFFQLMADEEQGHIDYLGGRLEEWAEDGTITAEGLETALPPRSAIA